MKRRTRNQLRRAQDLWAHMLHLQQLIYDTPKPARGGFNRWEMDYKRLIPKFAKFPVEIQEAAKLAARLSR